MGTGTLPKLRILMNTIHVYMFAEYTNKMNVKEYGTHEILAFLFLCLSRKIFLYF